MRFRVVGAKSRGRTQAVERLIELALLQQRDSEIVGEDPVRGVQRQGATQAGHGLVGPAEGLADASEPRPEVGIAGSVPEGLAVELLGLGQGAEALETGGESRKVGWRYHDGTRRRPPEQSSDHRPAIRSSASWSARVVVVFADSSASQLHSVRRMGPEPSYDRFGSDVMQGQSERRTDSLSPASAISPAACHSILSGRDLESSGIPRGLVSFPQSDRSNASSERSEPPCCESRLTNFSILCLGLA